MKSEKLKRRDFIGMFWRSFFIQAVWNYQSMLSIGFTFALIPVARRIARVKSDILTFYLRHIGFFNAHPYMASFALGAVARAESEPDTAPERIERLKSALIGPLGALGDQLFWGTIKPTAIMLGICGIILIENITIQVAAVILFVIIYNIPHFYIRWYGILTGYDYGYNVYKLLNLNNFRTIYRIFLFLGAFLLGLILSYAAVHFNREDLLRPAIFAFALGCAYFIWQWRKSFYFSILLSVMLSVILGIIIDSL